MSLRNSTKSQLLQNFLDKVWDTFVIQTKFTESRVLAAFNRSDPLEFQKLLRVGNLTDIRREQSARPQEWLEKHGTCGDHIKSGPSTIPQAGRGAFATRFLPEGTAVSHLPLIHISDKSVLEMFHFRWVTGKPYPDPKLGLQGYQLLLN